MSVLVSQTFHHCDKAAEFLQICNSMDKPQQTVDQSEDKVLCHGFIPECCKDS